MGITIHGLEAMGFKALAPGQSIKGTFIRVDVFAIQGIKFDVPFLSPMSEIINGVAFKIGFGSSLNAVCQQLAGDDYVDDEEQWKKDTQSNPPYMLLSFGPTDEYVGSGNYVKVHGDHLITYDSFRKAKQELREQRDAVVPSLLTSLSLTFSSEGRLVRFLSLNSGVTGKSVDGKTIEDIRIEFSASGFVSTNIKEDQIKEKTAEALRKARHLDKKIAEFYFIGSNEKDHLKRFLYFFLFVERLTHSTFKSIDHPLAVSGLLSSHHHVASYGQTLLNAHRDSWKDLRNRFIWCVMHKWTHMADKDVEEFERLKDVRDDISHGNLSVPNGAAVNGIEALALRIQGM